MKCKEHDWKVNGDRWVCTQCQDEAAAEDLSVLPCPRCGAPAKPGLVYCDVCLERIYRLEIDHL